jgi:preprotein translocase subunit SecB
LTKAVANKPGATEPPLDFSSVEYNHVAKNAKLDALRLLKFAMEAQPEIYSRENKPKLSYGRELVSCSYDADANVVAAIFRFSVGAKSGRSKVFLCQAEYAVVYDLPEDATRDASLAFCKHVGAFACYPYFRAAVSQVAWGSGMDLPPLPAIAAMPVVSKKDD